MIKKIINNEKKICILFLIVALLVLSIPLIFRLINKNPIITGEEPYYHLRIAKEIAEKKKIDYDPLSYAGRNYVFDPYDYFLAFTYNLFGNKIFIITPLILAFFSVILFFFIIKKLGLNLMTCFLIMLALTFSPIFIYTFTVLNKHSLVISLMLLGFLFFIDRRILLNVFSIIIFSTIPIFNTIASLIVILLVLSYSLYTKKKKKQVYAALIFVLLVNLLYYLIIYLKYGFPERVTFVSVNYLQILLSDLGSFTGLSLFTIMLTIIGLIATWEYKKKLWPIYSTILILLVSLAHFSYSNIYLKFVITIFTGIGFYKIISMEWKLKFIRDLSIFIVILGLIFSTTSHIHRLVNALPDKNIKESLQFLGVYSDPEEIVLSHYSRGFWIEYYANRASIIDSFFTYAPSPNERYKDINAIFYGVNLEDTKELLNKYNVNYIYIDNEMKKGIVWKKEKQGLLFLFRNNETFKNIYDKDGIEIWQYKKED